MNSALHISISAEQLFTIFGMPITNAILTAWIVMFMLIVLSLFTTRSLRLVPGKLQLITETIVYGLYQLFETVTGDNTKRFFPLLATLFIYIVVANWIGLLPGVGTIGLFKEVDYHQTFIPLLRSSSADLNSTLALALIAVLALQYFGIKTLGARIYLSRFINVKNPILLFVGLLEIISEFSKVVSFSFRLFGNIFAGEVLLTVVAFLMPLFVPLPFLALELFVGFIQALVFSMLTAVFLSVATRKVEH